MTPKTMDRREQLLDVALHLFAEKGYHATSISDIIESAGVARGTFYNYFENKRQIFGRLLDNLFADVVSVAFPIDVLSGEGVPAQVQRLMAGFCRKLLTNLPMTRVLLEHAVGLDDEGNEQLKAFYDRVYGRIRKAISDGQALGIVRPGQPSVIATSLLGMLKESLYQQILGTSRVTPDEMVEEIFAVATCGILLNPPGEA